MSGHPVWAGRCALQAIPCVGPFRVSGRSSVCRAVSLADDSVCRAVPPCVGPFRVSGRSVCRAVPSGTVSGHSVCRAVPPCVGPSVWRVIPCVVPFRLAGHSVCQVTPRVGPFRSGGIMDVHYKLGRIRVLLWYVGWNLATLLGQKLVCVWTFLNG